MALDLALHERAVRSGACCLRLYRWSPSCLSFGRHEPAARRYDRQRIEQLGLDTVRRLATPVASLGRELFAGPAAQLLLNGNAGHADFPLSSPGSGVFGVLRTMLGQTVGFPVPRGGAQQLTDALVARCTSLGAELVTDAEVTAVDVRDGRVAGVRTRDGQ